MPNANIANNENSLVSFSSRSSSDESEDLNKLDDQTSRKCYTQSLTLHNQGEERSLSILSTVEEEPITEAVVPARSANLSTIIKVCALSGNQAAWKARGREAMKW